MSILTSASCEPALGSTPYPGSALVKPTLLVVDDEEGPRQSIRIVFKEDYRILMCESGSQAVELARQHKIDVAILDIRMSGMSGIELLMKLKEIDPDLEVVMLTAYETLETARQALRLGACDYLNKPFDIGTLRDAIQTAMARRTLSNEIRANNQRLKELQEEIHNQKLREDLARTRGEIYASIIHDINGPLTIISGFIEVINQRIGSARVVEGENLEMIKDRLTRITRQVSNCIQICRRYLGLLRGRTDEHSSLSIKQVLLDMEELLKPHPTLQRNHLLIEPSPEQWAARMNGTDLIQVLLNLILNAFQTSEQGVEVEVRVAVLEQPIPDAAFAPAPACLFVNEDGFENRPPLLAVTVRDNGPGIPAGILNRIFDPYFTTKPSGHGTGLGLSIVRRLVQEARGALAVTSSGGGASFTVYLPALKLPPEPS